MSDIKICLLAEPSRLKLGVCERQKRKVRLLRNSLRKLGYRIFFSEGTAEGKHQNELEQLLTSDLCVVLCELPSTGQGIKIGIAARERIPVLLLSRGQPAQDIVEAAKEEPYMTLTRFQRWSGIPDVVASELSIRGISRVV